MKTCDVAIIGAGSGGLSARREIAKKTSNYFVIDPGPYGTTCARVGCMPSKVLIQTATDFDRRFKMLEQGIHGAENLTLDTKQVMKHVRSLRDRFVRGVTGDMQSWQAEKMIAKKAKFIDNNTLDCEGEIIKADKIVIASGSRPVIPEIFNGYEEFLITTDEIFELEDLPKSLAVIGLGVIGLEIGQSLDRLGVEVIGIGRREVIAGMENPDLSKYLVNKFSEMMNLDFSGVQAVEKVQGGLKIKTKDSEYIVEKFLSTAGRAPNLKSLDLGKTSILCDEWGVPKFDKTTFQVEGASNIFIAGDVTDQKQILHEASDEGKIAGFNCVNSLTRFKTRVPLNITFTDPNIADVGMKYNELKALGTEFETGKVSFEGQGRSIVKLKECGELYIYGDKKTGKLLGAEMFGPDIEHIAHLLSWAIEQNLTVNRVLSFPFYHPVIEEGLRTALRDLRSKVDEPEPQLEIYPLESK